MSFDTKAFIYDKNSDIQQTIAKHLLNLIFFRDDSITLLDVGCGTGYIAKEIKKINTKISIYQIDKSQNMCNFAKKHAKTSCCSIEDFDKSVFKIDKFDIVISSMTIQWCDDIEFVFKKVKDLLSTNGRVAISIPLDTSFQSVKNEMHNINLNPEMFFKKMPTAKDVKNLAIILNWEVSFVKFTKKYKNLLDFFKIINSSGSKDYSLKPKQSNIFKITKLIDKEISTEWSIAFITSM
jgi:ubiquinone/menaquinone biosynthesis C-methylase UbiE